MLRRFSLLMSLTLVVLVALVGFSGFGWLQPSAAQDDPPVRLDVGGINAEKFPTLTLLVNVWDEFDVPVSGLTVDDFQVTAGGAATSVLSVENITEDDLPISVVLVIDTSESMLGQPLDDAKAAALAFVDTLAPTDAVALVDFDSTVKVAVDFTTDRDVLRNAIENLRADGRTALYDAVYNAAELANESGNPRRFVVFLTDGNEYGGLSTQAGQAGVDLAVANNVPYYVFGLGYWLDEGYLNSLVRNSHGKVYLHPDSSTLAEAYAYLATFLRTQYVVTLDSGLEPDGRT
ncbi:MAG: VWA domain-containing protein, partial [Anaerolineae bacterium]|nr:VWA domain-containing protein [Anaerolineae bacterium]